MKKHTETSAVASLERKHDCIIADRVIYIRKQEKKNDLGNGSWGRIDFLKKVHNYALIMNASKALINQVLKDKKWKR